MHPALLQHDVHSLQPGQRLVDAARKLRMLQALAACQPPSLEVGEEGVEPAGLLPGARLRPLAHAAQRLHLRIGCPAHPVREPAVGVLHGLPDDADPAKALSLGEVHPARGALMAKHVEGETVQPAHRRAGQPLRAVGRAVFGGAVAAGVPGHVEAGLPGHVAEVRAAALPDVVQDELPRRRCWRRENRHRLHLGKVGRLRRLWTLYRLEDVPNAEVHVWRDLGALAAAGLKVAHLLRLRVGVACYLALTGKQEPCGDQDLQRLPQPGRSPQAQASRAIHDAG
mmetsp:Transcript_47218/g.140940  ORF Transcript_47218/g.140940 Transcript_47218/m.140940 type:complete len:283 (+) Transcript_47218:274-1122(+)